MKQCFKSFDELPLTLRAEQVAEILSLSRVKTYELLHQKTFPTIFVGKRMLVPKDKLKLWMEQNCRWDEIVIPK